MIAWQLKQSMKKDIKLFYFPSLYKLNDYLNKTNKSNTSYEIKKIIVSDQLELVKNLNKATGFK